MDELCTSLPKGTLTQSELIPTGSYNVINSGRDYYGKYDKFNNEGNAFTFASRGEYAGFVNYHNDKFWAGGLCYPYRSTDENKVLTKYLYYYCKYIEPDIMNKYVAQGSIPALNKADLSKVKIPLPHIAEQYRIVSILDKFDTICNNLCEGLPAEIDLMTKKYEYYRDLLLSF